MKTADLQQVLREFHRDKLALRERHVAVARAVSDYAFNNTYQYIIAREDTHLAWLEAALAELEATPDSVPVPTLPALGRKADFLPLVAEDLREAEAFAAKWRPRLDGISHDRHRKMMRVVVGETLEHKRFFEQMLAGRDDLLGRRANGAASPGTGNGVLASRWIE